MESNLLFYFVCYFLFHNNVLFIQINKFKRKVVQEIASPSNSFFILFEDRKVSSWSSAVHFQLFLSHSASKMSPSNLLSFSAALFSFYLLPFPASVSLPMGQLFASGGQSTGASASASVLQHQSFSISIRLMVMTPSVITLNEYSGLISFRIDWFDLLAVQGTLKSLL